MPAVTRLLNRLRRYASLPPRILFHKARRRLSGSVRLRLRELIDARRSSFLRSVVETPLVPHVAAFPMQEAPRQAATLSAACEHYLAHRFDLLGSGWVEVRHGMECRGIEGHIYRAAPDLAIRSRINGSNAEEAERIYALVSGDYTPLDWQLDFKSGYRWNERTWYARIAIITDSPGADIKVPWELARCQHLPQLALAHGLARAGTPGFRSADCYRDEFRNQVIDFIANNPPRFGVNWSCAMDVGIRLANWLLAYDLLLSAGAVLDPDFEHIFKRSVYEHGHHLAANLEWNDPFRSNHYLADLVGLLYAGAYLPASADTDTWLRLAAHELRRELGLQFNDDGSNFEGSTSYHRLSAELFTYAAALMLSVASRRLPLPWLDLPRGSKPGRVGSALPVTSCADIIPRQLAGRLERAAEFTMHLTRPDGRITQIGDNDSGRLFKLQPAYSAVPPDPVRRTIENLASPEPSGSDADFLVEDTLNHRHLVGALGALFDREDFAAFAAPYVVDAAIIRLMRGEHRIGSYRNAGDPLPAAAIHSAKDGDFDLIERALPADGSQRYRFRLGDSSRTWELLAYPDFGVCVVRNADFYLAIRCGPVGQAGNGGHAHNDQLAVELVIEGRVVARDPGSYLYTALPQRRNEYRSVRAHFAPRIDDTEPGDLSWLFHLSDTARARCLYFGPRGFIGCHSGYGKPVYRVVALEKDAVEIRDYAEGSRLARCRFTGRAEEPGQFIGVPFSPGYGLREQAMRAS